MVKKSSLVLCSCWEPTNRKHLIQCQQHLRGYQNAKIFVQRQPNQIGDSNTTSHWKYSELHQWTKASYLLHLYTFKTQVFLPQFSNYCRLLLSNFRACHSTVLHWSRELKFLLGSLFDSFCPTSIPVLARSQPGFCIKKTKISSGIISTHKLGGNCLKNTYRSMHEKSNRESVRHL